jgi:hypothetical protein
MKMKHDTFLYEQRIYDGYPTLYIPTLLVLVSSIFDVLWKVLTAHVIELQT